MVGLGVGLALATVQPGSAATIPGSGVACRLAVSVGANWEVAVTVTVGAALVLVQALTSSAISKMDQMIRFMIY
jgi:hypothetical protein